jgi:hypothetical protein
MKDMTMVWATRANDARKAYNRHVNWLNKTSTTNPSKAAKHRMYGDADAIARHLGAAHPHTLAEIGAVLHLAKSAGILPQSAKIA